MASSLYNKLTQIESIKNQSITVSNIKSGINIFGVNGEFTSDGNASPDYMVENIVAYSQGRKITGSLKEFTNETINIPFTMSDDPTNHMIHQRYNSRTNISNIDDERINVGNRVIRNNAYTDITYSDLANTLKINASNIKKGSNILDVEGLYDASTEFSGILMDPIVASETSTSLTRSIKEISGLDMTEALNLSGYLSNLGGLQSVSNLNTPNVTNLVRFVDSDLNLSNFSYCNFYGEEQEAVNCVYMFNLCTNLSTMINVVWPKSISNCSYMFNRCDSLVSVPRYIEFRGL